MKAVTMVLVLLAVSFAACREVPHFLARPDSPKATPKAAPAVQSLDPPRSPAALAAIAESPPEPPIDRSAQVAVLGYHRFVDKVRHPDTEITPADFEAQMKALKDAGIEVIPLADLLAWRHGQKEIPRQSAVITIDDGYNVGYTVAWPILKKFGYPATLFVYTDYIRGGPKSGGGSITWEQLAEMRDAGVAIGSHSISHRDLRTGRGRPKGEDYEAWLWKELNGSKEMLESRLGIKVTALALPYGASSPQVREMAVKAGYEMVFTVNGGKVSFDTPMDALGRYIVVSNQPKIFNAALTFQGGQGSGVASATSLSVQSIQAVPADDSVITDPHPLIHASLAGFDGIEAGSVSLRISGVGKVPATFDPQTKAISYHVAAALSPRKYTVILTATAEGRRLESRWTFTVQPDGTPAIAAPRETLPR